MNSRLRVDTLEPPGPGRDFKSVLAKVGGLFAPLLYVCMLPFQLVAGLVRFCYRFAVGLHWFVYRAMYAIAGMFIIGFLVYGVSHVVIAIIRHHV